MVKSLIGGNVSGKRQPQRQLLGQLQRQLLRQLQRLLLKTEPKKTEGKAQSSAAQTPEAKEQAKRVTKITVAWWASKVTVAWPDILDLLLT